jgi:hypothetical protein
MEKTAELVEIGWRKLDQKAINYDDCGSLKIINLGWRGKS